MRLIIDTDAGVDDSQAIMLALTHPGVSVEAITAVTGNVHVDHVTRNVFTILDIMGHDVPVFRGADQPLIPGFWKPEVSVHGEDGLGNLAQRPASQRQLEAEAAAVALVRLVDDAPGDYTLVALGPLTNIALACRLDSAFPSKVKQFVFMGGTIHAMGNARNVSAEYNFFCDPEAAHIALAAFPESTMLSWETTLRHPFSWEQFDALAALTTPAGRFFHDTTFTTVNFLRKIPRVPGYLLPDPLAMALTLDPSLVTASEHHHVSVEFQGGQTRGQTVIDFFGLTGHAPNVHMVTEMDIAGVYAMYQRALS